MQPSELLHARDWEDAIGDRDVLLVATAVFALRLDGREGDPERHTVLVTRDEDGYELSVGNPFAVVPMGRSTSLPALLMALVHHGEATHRDGVVFGSGDDRRLIAEGLRHWEGKLADAGSYRGRHPRTVAEFEVGGGMLSLLAADGGFLLQAQAHPRMVLCRSEEPEAILRAAGLLLDARTDRERMIVAGRLRSTVATFEAEVAERSASAAPAP